MHRPGIHRLPRHNFKEFVVLMVKTSWLYVFKFMFCSILNHYPTIFSTELVEVEPLCSIAKKIQICIAHFRSEPVCIFIVQSL